MQSGLKSKSSSHRLHFSSGAKNMTEEAFQGLHVSLSVSLVFLHTDVFVQQLGTRETS